MHLPTDPERPTSGPSVPPGPAGIAQAALLGLALVTAGCTQVIPILDDDDAAPDDDDAGDDDAGDDDAGDDDAGDDDAGDDDAAAPNPIDGFLELLDSPTADLDGAIADVAWSHTWPLTDGDRWLFVTRWDDAPPAVGLAGDWNSWSPAPANEAAAGGVYWLLIPSGDLGDAAGQGYKWAASGGVWRAPPEATAYTYDGFGELGYVAPPGDAGWRARFPGWAPPGITGARTVRGWFPAGYDPAGAARVLLMHDGQNLTDPDAFFGGWQVDGALSDAAWSDVVMLAADNGPDRYDLYNHTADAPSENSPLVGGSADTYLTALAEHLRPWAVQRWGLPADADAWTMAGSSLGGLVTLHQARTRPAEQACVIAMSSSLGWGAFDPSLDGSEALVNQWTGVGPSIYLDSGGSSPACGDGDGDGVWEDADQSDGYCVTIQLRDHLAAQGYVFETDLWHWHEADAPHNEAAWAARLPRALQACADGGWVAR